MLRFAIVLCAFGLYWAQEPSDRIRRLNPLRRAQSLRSRRARPHLLTTGENSEWAETAP